MDDVIVNPNETLYYNNEKMREIINLIIYKEVDEKTVSHRFPHIEFLFRGFKNFRNSFKPLNVYERVHRSMFGENFIRFGKFTKYIGYKGTMRKVNNLIF